MDNQPTQSTPPIPSPNHSPKTFLLILGAIVLMAVSAVGGYFIGSNKQSQTYQPPAQPSQSFPTPTPTPTPLAIPTVDPSVTANWKTYSTKAISFKYPSNWGLGPSQGEGAIDRSSFEQSFSNYPFKNKDSYGDYSSDYSLKNDYLLFAYSIAIAPEYKTKTMLNYLNENTKPADGVTYTKGDTVIVNGVNFIVYGLSYPPNQNYSTVAFTIKDGILYSITLRANSNTALENLKPTFDQILSTFKFTN